MFRRILLVQATFLFFAGAASAAEPITIRVAALLPGGSSFAATAREFATNLNQRLKDTVRVEIIPAPQDPNERFNMLLRGETEMALLPSTIIASSKVKDFALFDLPFLFDNLREVQALQESSLGIELLAAISNNDILGLGFWNGGMSQFFGKSVTSVSRLNSLKLRSTASSTAHASVEKLGVVAHTLPNDQVSQAIQVGRIDAAELPPHYVTQRVVPLERTTISPVNYRPLSLVVVVNKKFWKNLSFQVQSIIAEEVRVSARSATFIAEQMDEQALVGLRQREFTYASISPDASNGFKTAATSAWWTGVPISSTLLNKAISFLVGYRGGPPPVPRNPTRSPSTKHVLFGTDRKDEAAVDTRFRFGGERGPLLYGVLPVGVGPDRPVGDRSATQLGVIELQTKAEFLTRLASELDRASEKQVLVYIHGYNNSFSYAAETAALLAVDMKFQGVIVLFSWPSAASATDYSGDEDEVETSKSNFVEFVTGIRNVRGLDRLNVITHSMGSRLVAGAMEWMNGRDGYHSDFLYHLVLAAPDIYTSRFAMAVDSFAALAARVTLYASENDEALVCSQGLVHGKRRAGQAGADIVVVPKVDTVDATPADPRPWYSVPCTPIGHSYITHNTMVLGDFQNLIVSDIPPVKRPFLLPQKKADLDYWLFQTPR